MYTIILAYISLKIIMISYLEYYDEYFRMSRNNISLILEIYYLSYVWYNVRRREFGLQL